MKRAFVTTLTLSRRLIEATLFKLHSNCKLNAHESGKTVRKKGFSFSWALKGTNAWNQNFPIAFVGRRYLVKNYLGGLKIFGIWQFYVASKVISLLSFITWGEVCVNFGLARQAIKVWSFRRTVQFACFPIKFFNLSRTLFLLLELSQYFDYKSYHLAYFMSAKLWVDFFCKL